MINTTSVLCIENETRLVYARQNIIKNRIKNQPNEHHIFVLRKFISQED